MVLAWKQLGKTDKAIHQLTLLEKQGISCKFLTLQKAELLAGNSNAEGGSALALEIYKSLEVLCPNSLEGMDDYSNILFLNGNLHVLTSLAKRALELDMYDHRTNYILGNLYALKEDHAKAIEYFCKCVTLNRTCMAGWTLLGHSYLELKEGQKAIRSYEQAIAVSQGREYRAWFGLGQVHEYNRKYEEAIHYYKEAVKRRKEDPRIWSAIGSVFEKLANLNNNGSGGFGENAATFLKSATLSYEKAAFYSSKSDPTG